MVDWPHDVRILLISFRFSSVILIVTFKLCTHTKFWSYLLIFSILIISIGLYLAYMWVSNFLFSENIKGTTYTAWTTFEPYFVVLFCICFVLALDGVIISLDYDKGGYSSKMRSIISGERDITRTELAEHSMHLTEGLTRVGNND